MCRIAASVIWRRWSTERTVTTIQPMRTWEDRMRDRVRAFGRSRTASVVTICRSASRWGAPRQREIVGLFAGQLGTMRTVMTPRPHRVPIGEAAAVWVLVFLIGLTGGAVLRQRAAADRTSTAMNSPSEATVGPVVTPPTTHPSGSPSQATVPGSGASDHTTSTSATIPPTTAPPSLAMAVTSEPESTLRSTQGPSKSSVTTTSSTSPTTTPPATSPPQVTTTTIGCESSPCPSQLGEEAWALISRLLAGRSP